MDPICLFLLTVCSAPCWLIDPQWKWRLSKTYLRSKRVEPDAKILPAKPLSGLKLTATYDNYSHNSGNLILPGDENRINLKHVIPESGTNRKKVINILSRVSVVAEPSADLPEVVL